MYDLERIDIIITDIEAYLEKLISFNVTKLEDLNDDKNLYAVSMVIFNSLNRVIDLAEQIVNDKQLGVPLGYKELFIMICNKKIISKKLEESLLDLIRFRNKIAHRYGNIKNKEILEAMKKTIALKEFTYVIQKEVKKK